MTVRSKEAIRAMIVKDITDICEKHKSVLKSINEGLDDTLDYMKTLIAQIPQSAFGPLISKTPKVTRKKAVQRIETIPEDDIVDGDYSTVGKQSIVEEAEVTLPGRSRREASKKAAEVIRKQQSLSLQAKLRRPDEHENTDGNKRSRDTRSKRTLSSRSSDEDESRPLKHTKTEANGRSRSTRKNSSKVSVANGMNTDESPVKEEFVSMTEVRQSSRKRTIPQSEENDSKKPHIGDDIISPLTDNIDENSMYEDAIGKPPVPVMNSTMVLDKTKVMNVTVVLEPLPARMNFNETVTLKKKSSTTNFTIHNIDEDENDVTLSNSPRPKLHRSSKTTAPNKTNLQDGMQKPKESYLSKKMDELLTDDDSSPERKKPVRNAVKRDKYAGKQSRIISSSSSSSEDEVSNTPAKPVLRELNNGATTHEIRNMYKTNALFSPYAKDSVKKRVEAFEQAGMNSPKSVDIDAPTRVTRTKTRAMTAAEGTTVAAENANYAKSIAQKLARKSLAKAKKISLARIKDMEDSKENDGETAQKIKNATNEKFGLRQPQRVTPSEKTKIRVPMSASRIPTTPSNTIQLTNYAKAASATRGNIVTSVDSFIHSAKTLKKTTSQDKLDEKKRKVNDEDARRKREEALRLQTEEKRRKREEKELKNRLAREAKEKQEMEKRLRAEKEREEKARLAQQQQEKQREEHERKRLAQLQRAQEKEERRRQEEQLRLQRLYEQEEAERTLAEQRRREQEAEKRKEAETRAQQQATIEAMRLKNQMLMAQAKQQQLQAKKLQGPTNYILDSEPDDDDSDDESRPKYAIPYWAQPEMRKPQLAMQRFIPQSIILKFFDARRCTPDLTKLFNGIDKSRLKRTSSAIWKTPPRYSMMDAD